MDKLSKAEEKFSVVKLKGGLGNQIFQYVFSQTLIEQGHKIYHDISWFKSKKNLKQKFMRPLYLIDVFEVSLNILPTEKKVIVERFLKRSIFIRSFDLIIRKFTRYNLVVRNQVFNYIVEKDFIHPYGYKYFTNAYFDGYWASHLYFKSTNIKINELLRFKNFDNDLVNFYKKTISNSKDNVALHWRRGDYVNHSLLEIDLTEYMYRAIDFISKTKKLKTIFVFTEDCDYVKLKLKKYENKFDFVYVSEKFINEKDYYEMYLMSICENNIISNSSFSWWAAMLNLNPEKIVIAPDRWINKNYEIFLQYTNPNEWVTINVQ